MIKPLQTTTFPRVGSQQATAMQSTTLPTVENGTTSINLSELMNLMITMMIVMMMMKMMMGMMAGVGGAI